MVLVHRREDVMSTSKKPLRPDDFRSTPKGENQKTDGTDRKHRRPAVAADAERSTMTKPGAGR
jgi:hypothetical protein